jgi:hypothetical protein
MSGCVPDKQGRYTLVGSADGEHSELEIEDDEG